MERDYIGVDLHKAFFQVATVTGEGTLAWEARFPRTAAGLQGFLARCSPASEVAVEASGPTWTFADQVCPHVGKLVVVDPSRTRLKAGYAAKTDRLDARRLADALRRESVVRVYYPPPAIRELRELCRYRVSLARTRARVKQRVRALLLRTGSPDVTATDLAGVRGQQELAALSVAGWAGRSLTGWQDLLQTLTRLVAAVQTDVERVALADPIVTALRAIPGVGPVLGLVIRAEIGCITRFARADQLACYAGVVPRVHQSGNRCYYGRTIKQGSPWLRWALIEAAIHGPKRRDETGRWARRLSLQKGALKARVAIARALCDEVFVTWRQVG